MFSGTDQDSEGVSGVGQKGKGGVLRVHPSTPEEQAEVRQSEDSSHGLSRPRMWHTPIAPWKPGVQSAVTNSRVLQAGPYRPALLSVQHGSPDSHHLQENTEGDSERAPLKAPINSQSYEQRMPSSSDH